MIVSLSVCSVLLISQSVSAQFLNTNGEFTKDIDNINELIGKARAEKNITVIVGLELNITPEGYLGDS